MAKEVSTYKKENGPRSLETVRPDVLEAVNYLKHWKKDFLKNPEFTYLRPVFNILSDTLNPDLTTNLDGRHPLDSIAVHALESAGEKPRAIGNAISRFTIQKVNELLGQRRLGTYWDYSLTVETKHPSSLVKRGGVYRIGVRPDMESESQGGAEIQQALAAKLLQGAENARVMGNVPTHPEFESLPYPDRQAVSTSSADYLAVAKRGYLNWQKQKHLSHIRLPVESNHTHDELIILANDKYERRKVIKPSDARVRVFRASQDPDKVYYADVQIEEVLLQDPKNLGDALSSKEKKTGKIDWTWHQIGKIDDIPADNDPPSYSISSGIDESRHKVLQELTRSGKSIMHCNYDYGQLQLEFGHLYKDGGAAKQDARAVAYAAQFGRGDKLAPSRLPKTEILPPYENFELPDHDKLQSLLNELLLAKGDDLTAIDFRENPTLLRIVNSFGLQDLRLRFDEATPKDTEALSNLVSTLNTTFHAPKLEQLEQFIDSHQSSAAPLSEAGKKALARLVATKFQPQHIAEIAAELSLGPTAANDVPLKKTSRLTQRSIPKDTKDAPLFSKKWLERYWTELSLSQFSATSFNVLQLGSAGWRKLFLVGSETLGRVFSPKLTRKMLVASHFSDIGSFKSQVNGLDVELDYFETARPSMLVEEFVGSALGSMTHQEKSKTPGEPDRYTIRTTSRETLLPIMQNNLPIDNSEGFKQTLSEVLNDLIPDPSLRVRYRGQVMHLHAQWLQYKTEVDAIKPKPKFNFFKPVNTEDERLLGNIILTKLVLENEDLLRNSTPNSPIWQSFQILMSAGMRQHHKLRLENTYRIGA